MNILNDWIKGRVFLFMVVSLLIAVGEGNAFVAKESYDCNAEASQQIKTTIELKVSKKKYRKKEREIIKEVKSVNDQLKVRVLLFPFLDPPMNLGIGKCVSAENGRLAIKKALEYNRGVNRVIMQEFMPHHWAKIGATDLDELTFISITPEELTQLSDPSLSTEQFQALYQDLSALKERKLLFGLGTKKIEVDRSK